MKIAIVHDELVQFGGAERLTLLMHEIWPEAPIYTSVYAPKNFPSDFQKLEVKTSFMQKLPFVKTLRRQYFPFYPIAFESFDFSGFDVVISSSTRFAHGVLTKPTTLHICYSNAPTRFLWESRSYLERENIGSLGQLVLLPVLSYLRIWDQTAVQRPDFWIANSQNIAKKLKKFYRKDSEVIYPGVDLDRFKNSVSDKQSTKNYFLVVSRLLPWKRVDLAVLACSALKLPLIVVGDGPDIGRLKKIAGESVQFLGNVSDEKLVSLYGGARALIMTQEEDFGITALEAQAAGIPVIAYQGGGAQETVRDGKTGLFFQPQNEEGLREALIKFNKTSFSSRNLLENAGNFSTATFKSSLKKFVDQKWQEHQKTI